MSSKTYFDSIAADWDLMRQNFFPDEVREIAVEAAGVQSGELAGDLGAGSGFLTEALVKRGLNVIAVDQSQEMLEVMREKFGEGSPIIYRRGTAEDLPLPDDHLDYAFANMYLHHVERPPHAIAEMARTLKTGGKLVITDVDAHNFTFLLEEHHDRWPGFNREEVKHWFESAGLINIEVRDIGLRCGCDSECGTESANISIFLAMGTKASKVAVLSSQAVLLS